MKTPYLILMLLCLSSAHASLYECTSPNGKSKRVAVQKPNFEYVLEKPTLFKNEIDTLKDQPIKTPVLIYYAIDSQKPFMKYAVQYETQKLEEHCEKDKLSYAIILNSQYVKKNEIRICKLGTKSIINLNHYASLDSSLKIKRKFLKVSNHENEDTGPMKYNVTYSKASQVPFYNFPLAHPDFLFDLMVLLFSKEELFPAEDFLPFLNLKSHGSKRTVLSGLHKCQQEAKTKSQNEVINRILSEQEKKILNSFVETPKNDELVLRLCLGFLLAFMEAR